jgi:acyl-coenzyme A thioesterase PaaI-like protein
VIKSGRTLAVAHADVHAIAGDKRTLIAAAQQTLMVMHGASDDRI